MTKRIKSILPVYGMGLIFFIYAIFMPMHRITDAIIALSLAFLGYIYLNRMFPGKTIEIEMTYESGDKSVDQTLAKGREYIERLEELKALISDSEVSQKITRLQDISRQIFDYIAKNPAQARKINTFMDYYYPTALKFLDSYAEYGGKSEKGENIMNTLEKIRSSLAKFEEAFAHQLDNLYGDKALDIETDIAVLESLMKREGL